MKKLIVLLCLIPAVYLHAQWRTAYQGNDSLDQIVGAAFYSSSGGYIATEKWIGYTTDSGHTFQRRYVTNSNVNFGLNQVNLTFGFTPSGIYAFDNNTLLVSGNYGYEPSILSSADGGLNWQLVYHRNLPGINGAANSTYQMSFPGNGNTGFAVQNNEIIKTTNGGQTWQTVATSSGNLFTITFTSTTTGYAAGARTLFKTTDGGSNWTIQTVPFSLQTMTAASDQHLYAITTLGDCYSSHDGGSSWQQANTLTGQLTAPSINSIHFINDSTGYAFGPQVYQTRNKGRSWEVMPGSTLQRTFMSWQHPFFYTNQQAWVPGSGETLLITGNGGGISIPKALFDINTANTCSDNIVQLVNQSQPGYTYRWFRNNVLFATTYNAYYTATGIDDTIRLIVDNGTQSDTTVQIVTASGLTTLSLNSKPEHDTACSDATLNFNIFNSRTDADYVIRRSCCTVAGPYQGNGGTLTIPYPFEPNEDSTTTFTVTASSVNACGRQEVSQTHRVTIIRSNPVTNPVSDTICTQGTFYIRIPASRIGCTYWADPSRPVAGTGDTISLPCTLSQATSSAGIAPDYLLTQYHFHIYVSVTSHGCGPKLVNDAVMIGRNPGPAFDVTGYSWFTGETLVLNNNSKQAVSYLWEPGDGASFTTSTLTVPTLSYTTGGYKHLRLLAYSKEGCVDSLDNVVSIYNTEGAASPTNICTGPGAGNAVDSLRGSPGTYYVARTLYEDRNGDRVVAGGYTRIGYPVGLEGWYAVKYAKNGQLLWSLNQNAEDYYHSYTNAPNIIIEQSTGDDDGNTYLMGHAYGQLYVTATGEQRFPILKMSDFVMKVSAAGHIVWVQPFNCMSADGSTSINFFSGGSLLRGKDNTLYVVMQRYPNYPLNMGNTPVFGFGEGNEGVIMKLDTAGNLLRKNSFHCASVNLFNPYIGTLDNYWHIPPATWANGKLVIYTTLNPSQTTLEQASVGFNSAQISSALAIFDTATLHAVNVLPVYSTVSGAAAGVTADAYAMDSTGAYYASFMRMESAPALTGTADEQKARIYIMAYSPGGALKWTKTAEGLQPKYMLAFPGQLKVCGTNYPNSGWVDGGMKALGQQGPKDSTVRKLTVIGDPGTFSGNGGHGLGSLDIVVASLQADNGQLIDYRALGTRQEEEQMIMIKGAGNQVWIAGSIGAKWYTASTPADYAVYTYKLPISNDCFGGYPDQTPFLKWNTASDSATCTDSLYTLGWSSAGTGSLSIRYSTDDGAHYTYLTQGIQSSDNSYTFNAVKKGILGNLSFVIINDDNSAMSDTTGRRLAQTLTTSVTITTGDSVICQGAPVLFTATPINGGTAPVFQWLVNQATVGSNTGALSLTTLNDQDQVQVRVKGNQACSTPATAISNSITMHVTTKADPKIQISGITGQLHGKADTLYAHTINTGGSPTFSWQDSTVTHGWMNISAANDSILYYTPVDSGDEIRCIVHGHETCRSVDTAVSNIFILTIQASVTPPHDSTGTTPDSASESSGQIHAFPNPVHNTITIDTLRAEDEWESLNIVDLNGKVIVPGRPVANQSSVTVHVEALPKGIYYIRIIGKKRKAILRFLKL